MKCLKVLFKFLGHAVVLMTVFFSFIAWKFQTQEKEPYSIWANFTASGWMGDGEQGEKYIQLQEAFEDKARPDSLCIRINYKPSVAVGWAGIYWQNEPDNWGDVPGKNFSKSGYKKLTFWAKGETGRELVEFKVGGINQKRYKDSFAATTGKIVLKKTWTQYTLDLTNKNLSSVIGGFCWVASKSGNPNGLTFYLDDMQYE